MLLEDIDMTEVDSQFADELIKEAYKKVLQTIPMSDVINPGDKLLVESDFGMKIEYRVPPIDASYYMECFPRKYAYFNIS